MLARSHESIGIRNSILSPPDVTNQNDVHRCSGVNEASLGHL